jgi:hypothetical protein
MKRSSNITLVAMAALAFTASFAGGSAFLALNRGQPSQTCTKGTDGIETCTPSRGSGGYGRYFGSTFWSFWGDPATRTPAASAMTGSPARSTPGGAAEASGVSRGGFGSSARAASAHGSAAG